MNSNFIYDERPTDVINRSGWRSGSLVQRPIHEIKEADTK